MVTFWYWFIQNVLVVYRDAKREIKQTPSIVTDKEFFQLLTGETNVQYTLAV